MKRHAFYRWLRRMAMFSGIPALTMMFACAKEYGPPSDVNWSEVLEKVPVSEAHVQDEDGESLTTTEVYDAARLP